MEKTHTGGGKDLVLAFPFSKKAIRPRLMGFYPQPIYSRAGGLLMNECSE